MTSNRLQFEQIVCVDKTGLTIWGMDELQNLSKSKVAHHSDCPRSDAEIIGRIGGADCILVTWGTQIRADVLRASPRLAYVAMCCSLYNEASANVDINAARELGITVRGIRDYGDEGLVEFILAEPIRLFKGLGNHQWKAEPQELSGRKLGIIGLGRTGQMLGQTAS